MSVIGYGTVTIFFKDKVSCSPYKKFIFFALLLALVSCTSPAAKKNRISLMFVASSDLNPDINGRPSPLALTIYQMKNSSMFKKTDYVSLAENSKSLLEGDLIAVNTVIINPGQTLKLDYSIAEGEGAFGIVAGYRVIDSSIWQLAYDYPSTKTGVFSKLSGPLIYSHKVLLERNKMQFKSSPKEH